MLRLADACCCTGRTILAGVFIVSGTTFAAPWCELGTIMLAVCDGSEEIYTRLGSTAVVTCVCVFDWFKVGGVAAVITLGVSTILPAGNVVALLGIFATVTTATNG